MNRFYTVISILNLLLLLDVLLAPEFYSGGHFSLGGFGPFEESERWLFGCLTVALAVNPLVWTLSFIRRARGAINGEDDSDPSFCKSCGYDLRATSDRCPECGTETRRSRSKTSYFA